MKLSMLSLVSGLIFGVGLVLSGMTQPSKVINFLNVAGEWDPSLAFVMVGAIAVHMLAYVWVKRLPNPLLSASWHLPTQTTVDAPLLVGAILFGAGWGLGGYCPGPAIVSLVSGAQSTVLFVVAMLTGMWGYSIWVRSRGGTEQTTTG